MLVDVVFVFVCKRKMIRNSPNDEVQVSHAVRHQLEASIEAGAARGFHESENLVRKE